MPAARVTTGSKLNAPRQVLDPVRTEAAGSELDSSVELLLILFHIAQKARELGVLQRDNENQSIIHAQKAQVDVDAQRRHADDRHGG